MKKNFLLISSLALFATIATASTPENTVPQLPAHVVEVARYTAGEKAIEAGLAELRATAQVLPVISVQPVLPQREIVQRRAEKLVPVAANTVTPLVVVKA